MQSIKLREILKILNIKSEAFDPDVEIRNISTDTRTIKPGDLFIPLRGENFDGHRFIDDALKNGAIASLSSEGGNNGKVLAVEDTLLAYHAIASHYRERFTMPVIAITGSNGKTTTKDLVTQVLSQKFKTLKTPENFNNEIGVPQTMLQIAPDTEMVVIELAMRGKGQIRQLADIVKPDVGIITNIGEAHYELLGSYQAIADAKAELLEELPSGGAALLNIDDKWFTHLSQKTSAKVLSFGQREGALVRLLDHKVLGVDGFHISVSAPDGKMYEFEIPCLGFHNVYNSLAAIAAGLFYEVDYPLIRQALLTGLITDKRMEKLVTASGVIVINDTYNASPRSTGYAIKTLTLLPEAKKRVIVLGDMRELGEISEESHRDIGRAVCEAKIDYLVTLGDMGKWIYEGAKERGMASDRCFWFKSRQDAMEYVVELLEPGDVALVKASRLMKFEEIVDYIVKNA